MRDPGPDELLEIVFLPEGVEVPAVIRAWQARNPDWRSALSQRIECPVCGLKVQAIADLALLGESDLAAAIRNYRDAHLRSACSDHWWPTEEYWAYIESRTR
jgi:hypothetical protein